MTAAYESDIVLGEKYLEPRSGIEGTATAISFYEYGCERVTLETFNETRAEVQEYTFDSPRLQSIVTGETAQSNKTGGARPSMPRRGIK